eukprot:4807525-Lingulodinium_polyedra.AAC.1
MNGRHSLFGSPIKHLHKHITDDRVDLQEWGVYEFLPRCDSKDTEARKKHVYLEVGIKYTDIK